MGFIEDSMMNTSNLIAPFIPVGNFSRYFCRWYHGGLKRGRCFFTSNHASFFSLKSFRRIGYIARASLVADRVMGLFGLMVKPSSIPFKLCLFDPWNYGNSNN